MGQIYNGTFWRAIFWLIITPGLWIGSGGTRGRICHIMSGYTAYSYAKNKQESLQQRIQRGRSQLRSFLHSQNLLPPIAPQDSEVPKNRSWSDTRFNKESARSR